MQSRGTYAFMRRKWDLYGAFNRDNLLPDMQLNRRSRLARDTESDMGGSWVILGGGQREKKTLHLKPILMSILNLIKIKKCMCYSVICGFIIFRAHAKTDTN